MIADMIIGTLYTPFLFEAALQKYLGPSIAPKKKKRSSDPTTDKAGILEMFSEVQSRFTLNLSIWMIIASKYLPRRWRSTKANSIFEMMEKN